MVALLGISKGTFLEKFSRRDASGIASRGSYYGNNSSFFSSKRGSGEISMRQSVSPSVLRSFGLPVENSNVSSWKIQEIF